MSNEDVVVLLTIPGYGNLRLEKHITSAQGTINLSKSLSGLNLTPGSGLTTLLTKTLLASNPGNSETKYVVVEWQ